MVRYKYPQYTFCFSPRRLQNVSRHIFKTSSRRLQNFFSIKDFCLSRRLLDVLRDVFKTSSRHVQNVFARRPQDVLEDQKLLLWIRVEDVFNRCLEDVFKTSWRPSNVWWVSSFLELVLGLIVLFYFIC